MHESEHEEHRKEEVVEQPIHAYPPTSKPEIKSFLFNLAGMYGEGMAIAFILGALLAAFLWMAVYLFL